MVRNTRFHRRRHAKTHVDPSKIVVHEVERNRLFAVTLLITLVAYFTSEITLTNRRLLFRTGFLSRQSGELPLENVESIFILEPFFGRIFGYGTIMVTSAGGGTFPLNCICSPKLFHTKLQDAVNNAKYPRQLTAKSQNPPQDDSRYMPKK